MGLGPTQGDEKPGPVTTLYESAPLPFVISTGEVMGPQPTQGDEKRLSSHQPVTLEAPPHPLSSRPKRSAVERSLC